MVTATLPPPAPSSSSPAAPSPAAPAADKASNTDKVQALQQFAEFERNFCRDHYPLWLGTLVGPWLLTVTLGVLLYLFRGPEFTGYLLAAGTLSFVIAGRGIILMQGLSDFGPLTPEHLFWLVTYQDVMVALFMAFHVGFLFRLPWIGPKFLALTADGEMILSYNPWMRHLTLAGLIAFIAFPLAATGSVGGAIFGRLLGLSRAATFWGSVTGAVIGNALVLWCSRLMMQYLPADSVIVQFGGPLLVLGVLVILERRYAALKRNYLRDRQPVDL